MADVQCGKFASVRRDPQTGKLKFRAKLTPAPSSHWTAVFHEYQASERGLGNLAVARIFKEDVIEFDVPEAGSKAAAEVIRRCVERTNPEARKRSRLLDNGSARLSREWKRVQGKYRDAVNLLDMSDPPRFGDEAVVMLHELLNLGVRGHFMASTIMPSCMKGQDGFVATHVAGEGSSWYSAGLRIPSAE